MHLQLCEAPELNGIRDPPSIVAEEEARTGFRTPTGASRSQRRGEATHLVHPEPANQSSQTRSPACFPTVHHLRCDCDVPVIPELRWQSVAVAGCVLRIRGLERTKAGSSSQFNPRKPIRNRFAFTAADQWFVPHPVSFCAIAGRTRTTPGKRRRIASIRSQGHVHCQVFTHRPRRCSAVEFRELDWRVSTGIQNPSRSHRGGEHKPPGRRAPPFQGDSGAGAFRETTDFIAAYERTSKFRHCHSWCDQTFTNHRACTVRSRLVDRVLSGDETQ